MGWLRRLFGVTPKEEFIGIELDLTQPYWELVGPKTFQEMFRALEGWLPEGAVLYFEGGRPDREIKDFLAKHSVPEPVHLAIGTIWPRPRVFHVPATEMALAELVELMEHHAEPELASHFHVYRDDVVLIQWHDAFYSPRSFMLVSGAIPEEQVKAFADKIGGKLRKMAEPGVSLGANKGRS